MELMKNVQAWTEGAEVGWDADARGAIIPAAVGVYIGCGMAELREKVMAAKADLVEVVHTLKQVLCVKG